jgi:DNA-binding response OmpR family regulator
MNEFRTKDEEIAFLRKKNRELEEAIQDLKERISARDSGDHVELVALREALGVSITQAKIARLLSTGRPFTRAQILDEYTGERDYETRNVDSQIKRIRQKGKCEIKTIYGYGYQATASEAERLRAIMQAAKNNSLNNVSESGN